MGQTRREPTQGPKSVYLGPTLGTPALRTLPKLLSGDASPQAQTQRSLEVTELVGGGARIGTWPGSPTRTPWLPGWEKMSRWASGGALRPAAARRPALPLPGREQVGKRKRGQGWRCRGDPGPSHSGATSRSPSWVLTSPTGPPCMSPAVYTCVYCKNKSQPRGLSSGLGNFFQERVWTVVAVAEGVEVGPPGRSPHRTCLDLGCRGGDGYSKAEKGAEG